MYDAVTLWGCSSLNILDTFYIDLCLTILNFQTCSRSVCLVNTITPQELHAHICFNFTEIFSTSKSQPSLMLTFVCNCTGSDILLIRISAMFDVDLCVTFLNFQFNSKSNDFVNAITPQKFGAPCCSFIGIFFTSSFMLIFM